MPAFDVTPLIQDQPRYGGISQPFGFQTLMYPLDLGSRFHPYAIVFWVRRNFEQASKYNDYFQVNAFQGYAPGQQGGFGGNQYRLGYRTTLRTTHSIRLYVPDTLNWSFTHKWEQTEMTTEFSRVGAIADILKSTKKIAGSQNIWSDMKNKIPEVLGAALGSPKIEAIAANSLGFAVNPNIEVLYNAPGLRKLSFQFDFAPRSEAESNEVDAIIQSFKFYAAPEINADVMAAGRYYLPPDSFDIEFYDMRLNATADGGTAQNIDPIGRFATCVLEDINVDYAAAGQFAMTGTPGFSQPSHRKLTLTFMETEFITKDLIKDYHF